MTNEQKRLKVLFLCTGNSCRSQMAEGWARHLKGDVMEPHSAGIEAHGLNRLAVKVMAEAGVDISGHRSKLVGEVLRIPFDYVVTVCGHAHEHCPLFPGGARVIHVGFDDPPSLAQDAKTEEEAMGHYRRVRDEIRAFVEGLPEGLPGAGHARVKRPSDIRGERSGTSMILLVCVFLVALAFEYVNGFHDTANSIATTVSTKVLTPRQAVVLAAVFNLAGALAGVSVATTIGKGLVDTSFVTTTTILCALLGAIAWNLLTWGLGLPSSSSHALIGGLCGATLASAHGQWEVIRWSVANPSMCRTEGLWHKVVIPMFVSPALGIIVGMVLMALLMILLHRLTPRLINAIFGKLQLVSAAFMGFSHGTNDAQKTMGIIALVLFTASRNGTIDRLPAIFHFLETPQFEVATWVKVVCALTMASGTAAGGWRIIRTLGHKMVRLQPIHGFAAETTAATIIQVASHCGIPLSTTHVISAAIMGVGATKRFSAVKWGIVGRMVWAWVLTLPVTGLLAYWLQRACMLMGDGRSP